MAKKTQTDTSSLPLVALKPPKPPKSPNPPKMAKKTQIDLHSAIGMFVWFVLVPLIVVTMGIEALTNGVSYNPPPERRTNAEIRHDMNARRSGVEAARRAFDP